MDGGDLRGTVVGFAAALVVLAVLFSLVGVGRIVAALVSARPAVLLGVFAVAVSWLLAWGLALRTVLGVLDAPIGATKAVFVYAGATFANNITPFGQAGGEPVSALLISRAADSRYETGLAAIASVDALHLVPSTGLAVGGLGFIAATVTLGRRLEFAALAVGALALAIPVAGYVGWRHRYRIEAVAVRVLTPVVGAVGRLLPRRSPPDDHVLERRIEGFFAAIDRIAADRESLLLALGFSALGWIALGGSLWLSLFSLGHTVSFAAVLIAVPVGAFAGITPLPGGLGGVETVLVAVLVPTTAALAGPTVDPAAASAAVVIHRAATYVFPTVIGGVTAAVLGAG